MNPPCPDCDVEMVRDDPDDHDGVNGYHCNYCGHFWSDYELFEEVDDEGYPVAPYPLADDDDGPMKRWRGGGERERRSHVI